MIANRKDREKFPDCRADINGAWTHADAAVPLWTYPGVRLRKNHVKWIELLAAELGREDGEKLGFPKKMAGRH